MLILGVKGSRCTSGIELVLSFLCVLEQGMHFILLKGQAISAQIMLILAPILYSCTSSLCSLLYNHEETSEYGCMIKLPPVNLNCDNPMSYS